MRVGGRREVGSRGGERGGEELQRADDSCRRLKLEPVEPQGQSGEELLRKSAKQKNNGFLMTRIQWVILLLNLL